MRTLSASKRITVMKLNPHTPGRGLGSVIETLMPFHGSSHLQTLYQHLEALISSRKEKFKNPFFSSVITYRVRGFNSKELCFRNFLSHSPIPLANISAINLVSIFRCPSSKTDPVYGSRVNSFVLVCSLSSHRHLFIPLIFGSRFDS